MFSDLRAFLDALRQEGELVTVDAEVDPHLEMAEIHRRVIAAGGPALLFERVRGSPMRAVSNLFGTARRIEMAFGSRPRRFVEEAADLAETLLPPSLGGLWDARGFLLSALRIGLRTVARARVAQQEWARPDLGLLPATTSWPEDGGPFLTLPLVYTEPPQGGPGNLGIYRMQIHTRECAGMHWQIGKGGGFHYHEAERAGRALPVTVSLGGPPALLLSAVAPLPEGVPEVLLASLLLGRRLPVYRRAGLLHPLPEAAELALVGKVPPEERRPEGPFGDHYGYYSLRHDYPVFHCTRMLGRADPIIPFTVVGKPRQEDFYLGDFLQHLLSPLFPRVMPSVKDIWAYGETGYHSLAAAVVQDRYAREAMMSAFRILGEGQLSLTKFLLVVDRPMDLRDFRSVLVHVLERVHWARDLYIFGQLSMDTLDYTGPEVNKGSKGVILALGDPVRELPSVWEGGPPAGCSDAVPFCEGCLVVQGGEEGAQDARLPERIARDPFLSDWPLVVLVDRARETAGSPMRFLWTTFTRFEPAADVHACRSEIVKNHISYTGPIVIDARLKAGFPKELFCDPETAATVTRRWKEYFPRGDVVMGDSDEAHLSSP